MCETIRNARGWALQKIIPQICAAPCAVVGPPAKYSPLAHSAELQLATASPSGVKIIMHSASRVTAPHSRRHEMRSCMVSTEIRQQQVSSCLLFISCTLFPFVVVNIMAPNYRDDPSSNAPEVAHQESAFLYPANEQSHAYAIPSTKSYHDSPPVETQLAPVAARGGWRRWWILALLGLLIALIAGLVGGFIGQAIQKGREPAEVSATPSPSPSNGSSSAITPPPNLPAGTIGTIVVPETGCNFPTLQDRRRLPNITVYSRKSYTTVCNSGWKNSGILGLWTLTPSDCIEACVAYNEFNRNVASQRPCVGAGFIPRWVNQTLASKMNNGTPFNCFPQANASNIAQNDASDLEVVALCLEGKCNGAGT
jgi:hypothetical protein